MENPQQDIKEIPIEVEVLGESFSRTANISDEQIVTNGKSNKSEENKGESNDAPPSKEAFPLYKAKEHDSQVEYCVLQHEFKNTLDYQLYH